MANTRLIVGQSIMLELETLLSILCNCYPQKALTSRHATILERIPDEIKNQVQEILEGQSRFFSFLDFASALAGVILDGNYERASLAIRSLTPSKGQIELMVHKQLSLYAALGVKLSSQHKTEDTLRADAELAVRILKDGDLHNRFWLLVDRLYYQYWLPFRQEQADKMQLAEATLKQALAGKDIMASLERLPAKNPLRLRPEMAANAQKLGLKLFFWSEPIGLADSWFVTPKVLGVSFAEPKETLENLRSFAEDITKRSFALADPTRLIILRLIREFGKNNTEIAQLLDISRPTVSNHAKILREAGLITSYQEGGKTIHQLQEDVLPALFEDLRRFLGFS